MGTIFVFLFMVAMCYAAYRIFKKYIPEMKVNSMLNKFLVKESPVQNGGRQPHHDLNSSMSNDHRLKEVNQLERVFENGYKVSAEGEWRG